jgi:hypothetical protein
VASLDIQHVEDITSGKKYAGRPRTPTASVDSLAHRRPRAPQGKLDAAGGARSDRRRTHSALTRSPPAKKLLDQVSVPVMGDAELTTDQVTAERVPQREVPAVGRH